MTRPRPSLLDWFTHPLTALLLIGLIAALIYSNTFSASFHFDDVPNITDNPRIKHIAHYLDFSGSRYFGFLSFALNYHFGGLSLFGFHLVNLLIHITNGVLVYWLIRLLFQSPRLSPNPAFAPAAPVIALCTALLFVVHPVQTQAVTYIVQRFASLATLFYLLTVVCYLRWRLNPPDKNRRHLWYAAAFLATIMAMKTKEITFTLPFMLLLVEFVAFGPPGRKQWIGLIPFFLTLPVIPLSRPGAMGEGEVGLARQTMDISRMDYLFTEFRVIVTYLRVLVLPVNQNLDYNYPVSHSLFEPAVFLSFLFLAALGATAIFLLFSSRCETDPRLRLIGFGILWFFLTLAIESSIIPIRDVIFEHRLYLPSVGFWLAATTALFGFFPRWRVPVAIGVGILIVLFSIATYQRNRIWQDEFSLWSDVVKKRPNKVRGYLSLGVAYKAIGQIDQAIQEYKTAIALQPDFADAHNNLGVAYKEMGKYDDAIAEYKTALSIDPGLAMAHNNLGETLDKLGRIPEAFVEIQKAAQLNPDDALIHYNLGNIYREAGQFDKAIQEFKTASILNPDHFDAYNNLGLGYYIQGKLPEALLALKRAVQIKPDYAEAHNNLGVVYKELNQYEKAIQEFQAAIRLKPDHVDSYYNLGNTYQSMGRIPEAAQAFEQALQIKPDYDKARQALDALHR
jgi:tetratricopeptide (TPR) repeat protein